MVAFTITPSRAAARLNSGVRRRQTKIFSTWGSPANRHCGLHYPSATYSVQLESSCTPSVVAHPREKLAGAQNEFCAADLAFSYWARVRQVSQAKASLVSRLTIRSSRVRFAASDHGSYDCAIASAAPLPGLTQALGRSHERWRFGGSPALAPQPDAQVQVCSAPFAGRVSLRPTRTWHRFCRTSRS